MFEIALGTKIVVIMFCISAVLFLTDPSLLGTGFNAMTSLGIYNTSTNNTTAYFFNTSNITGTVQSNTSGFSSGTYIVITDLIRVLGFVDILKGLATLFFAPAMSLQNAHAPFFLVLVVGGVWTIMYLFAFIGFVRGRDV